MDLYILYIYIYVHMGIQSDVMVVPQLVELARPSVSGLVGTAVQHFSAMFVGIKTANQ